MLAAIREIKNANAMVTKIDRRACTRRVPMKVLILGMPRTGSTCMITVKALRYLEL